MNSEALLQLTVRNSELKSRSPSAALGHLVLTAILMINTPLLEQLNWAIIPILFIAISNVARLWICRKSTFLNIGLGTTNWYRFFSALVILNAFGWGLLVHFLFSNYGLENMHTMLCYMFFAGLTAGAASSLSPAKNLAHAFTSILLSMPAIDLFASGEPAYIWMGCIFVFYYLFMQSQIIVQSETLRKMKENEIQFRLLSSSTFEGVSIHSDGVYLEVNDAYARLFGYTPQEMIGQKVALVMPEFEQARLYGIIRNRVETPYEAQFIRKDGSLFYGESIGRATMHKGRSSRINCIRDISERVNAEHNRKKTDQKLRDMALAREKIAIEASQMKSDFLANMSHEIRTPLNGIIGTTELLLNTPMAGEQLKFSNVIRESGETLLTIINDLLDFSKIEAGKLDLEKTEFSVVVMIENQMELLASKAHEKRISLLTHIDPQVPAFLWGDSGRLSQVILNLVGNAIKFTEKGSVTLAVSLLQSKNGQVKLRVSIKDTGIGIPETTIEKLFQPFIQADSSTARKFGGSGLGLSICRQLVKLMNGEIGVNSSIGHGSEFWFTVSLPVGSKTAADARDALHGVNALLRCDDVDVSNIIVSYLNAWQIKTTVLNADEITASTQPFEILIVGENEISRGFNPYPDRTVVVKDFAAVTSLHHQTAGLVAKPIKQSELYDAIANVTRKIVKIESRPLVAETVSAKVIPLAKKRVLVAEDNAINQMLAESNLQRLGYGFRIVKDGNEVLKALEEESFDLILMDCHMPDLDGYDTTKVIRVKEKATSTHVPIIALTANAMKDDEQKCLDVGMDDYLSKPLRSKALEAKLKKWLETA